MEESPQAIAAALRAMLSTGRWTDAHAKVERAAFALEQLAERCGRLEALLKRATANISTTRHEPECTCELCEARALLAEHAA